MFLYHAKEERYLLLSTVDIPTDFNLVFFAYHEQFKAPTFWDPHLDLYYVDREPTVEEIVRHYKYHKPNWIVQHLTEIKCAAVSQFVPIVLEEDTTLTYCLSPGKISVRIGELVVIPEDCHCEGDHILQNGDYVLVKDVEQINNTITLMKQFLSYDCVSISTDGIVIGNHKYNSYGEEWKYGQSVNPKLRMSSLKKLLTVAQQH